METITKYKANDGKEFTDYKACKDYETLIEQVGVIMKKLSPMPDDSGCRFSNGHGFIQHDKKTLFAVKKELLLLVKKHISHEWIDKALNDDGIHPSWVGRLLSDYGISPLDRAWYRFQCIDEYQREWGQPFYANNPTKGEAIKLN